MSRLSEYHPQVYQHFQEGLHVIRRSDRLWAGQSPDLIIEQCLMRSLKTTGGLTRGRGFSETQRLLWVLSMPACAEVNSSMQQLTGMKYTTSEQHKDATQARVARDMKDTQEVLRHIAQRSPFTDEPSLRNISTGVTASPSVNVHDSQNVGKRILASMEGKTVAEYTFRKKDQAVTMDVKSTIKVRDEPVQVDPQLLFQRLITIGTKNDEVKDVFDHELCQYPPALFESSHVMRSANKSSLGDALWTSEVAALPGPSKTVQYVLDGGALLHRIPWTRGSRWEQIFEQYKSYVLGRYGKAVVVFDGYGEEPSTKDCAHMRRTGGKIGAAVHFIPNMTLQTKKEEFLSNQDNNQKFIAILAQRLEQSGCEVHQAKADADLLIVQTAIASAANQEIVVVGNYTDLLVLLVHHAKNVNFRVFLKCEAKNMCKGLPDGGTLRRCESCLAKSFPKTFSSSMRSSVVTPHRECLELARN